MKIKIFDRTARAHLPDFPLELKRESVLGRIQEWCDEGFLALAWEFGMLFVDRRSNRILVHYPTVQAVPTWDRCAPFRIGLGFLAPGLGVSLVHGAALSLEGKSLLLVGKGGSGKSSTALTALCPENSFQFLSEDYTVVDSARMVWPLYQSAKVDLTGINRMPWLNSFPRLGEQDGKQCLQVPTAGKSRIAALVWPDRDGDPAFSRISSIKALTHLAPSTLFQNPLAGKEDFRALVSLCRDLPCFRLGLADNPTPRDVTERLTAILEEAARPVASKN